MAFGKPKEPKAPKEKKPKPPKKEKPPKKPKPPKKAKPPKKSKAPKRGEAPVEGEELEQGKKKKPIILILLSLVVIIAAAVIVFFFVLPGRNSDEDPDASATVEPQPPVLPTELPVGDEKIPGMVLEADESAAKAVLAKTITYTYIDLADAGKVAETYTTQLRKADPAFSVVDEEFVRTDPPDFTVPEGEVLLARTLPQPAPETPDPEPTESDGGDADPEESGAEPTATPEPEPTPEPVSYVLTVRITWSEGQCVVTADEMEGKVTSPPRESTGVVESLSVTDAQEKLEGMTPAQLGLNGTTMDVYDVFPIDGIEMVDGVGCIRLYVYSTNNPQHTNEFMGSYLASIDGKHVYRIDPVTGAITVLE